MKKSVLVLLIASLFFVFAACSQEPATEPEADPDTNVEEDVDKAPDPDAPVIEEVLGDPSELEAELGIIIDMDSQYPVSRYAVIDDNKAQVEFYVGSDQVMGRVAKGQQENMSGYTSAFDVDETVDVDGLSVRLRYADPEKSTNFAGENIAIADAYDAEKDLSYTVVIMMDGTKDKLIEGVQALVASASVSDVVGTAN